MTYYYNIELDFEQDFETFLQNRMYPPGYGKESPMKKMTPAHAAAVNTSRLFLHKALDRQPEPRFRQEIEKEIELLTEVRAFILHTLYTPNLPFNDSDKGNPSLDAPGVEHYGTKDARKTD